MTTFVAGFFLMFIAVPLVCIVQPQRDSRIRAAERGNLRFKKIRPDDTQSNHYIVYTWGSSDFPLNDLDMRGH